MLNIFSCLLAIKIIIYWCCKLYIKITSTSYLLWKCENVSCLVMSDSLHPHRLEPTRLLCAWNSPGKNTGLVVISLSRESSQHRDWTQVSCIAGRFCTIWATPLVSIFSLYYIFYYNGVYKIIFIINLTIFLTYIRKSTSL